MGFGCGVVLGVILFLLLFLRSFLRVSDSEFSVWEFIGIGVGCCILFGMVGAKYGDIFFEWILRKLPWLFPVV